MPDFFPVSFSSFHKHKLHGSRPPHPLPFLLVMQKWKKKNRKNLQTFIFASFCSFCRVSPSCLPSFVIVATSTLRGQICVLEQVTLAHTHTHREVYTRTTSETRNHNELKRSRNVFVAVSVAAALSLLGSSADSLLFVETNEAHHVPTALVYFYSPPTTLPQPSFKAGGGVGDCVVVCLAGAGHHLPPAH